MELPIPKVDPIRIMFVLSSWYTQEVQQLLALLYPNLLELNVVLFFFGERKKSCEWVWLLGGHIALIVACTTDTGNRLEERKGINL